MTGVQTCALPIFAARKSFGLNPATNNTWRNMNAARASFAFAGYKLILESLPSGAVAAYRLTLLPATYLAPSASLSPAFWALRIMYCGGGGGHE